MSGWQYFRTVVQGDVSTQLFPDNAARIQKYRRVMNTLVVVFLPPFILFTINRPENTKSAAFTPNHLLLVFLVLLEMLFIYVMARLSTRIRQLQGKK